MFEISKKLGIGSQKRSTAQRLETGPEYIIDTEHRIVLVKFGRILKVEDIKHYVERIAASPSFDPKFSEIVDLSEVERVDLRGEDVLFLADHIDPFSFDSKRAFITKNEMQNHEVRMYQISRMAKDKIRSFRSVEEAEHWIFKKNSTSNR